MAGLGDALGVGGLPFAAAVEQGPARTLKRPRVGRPEVICSGYTTRCYGHVHLPIQWNQLGFGAPVDFAAAPNFELLAVLKKK
jgi:hypothetical protein